MSTISDRSVSDVLARASALGNHHLKHIFNIERNFDSLVSMIEKNGLIDQFQFGVLSPNPGREMKLIVRCSEERSKTLEMLGCYFSLQFLTMNIKALDILQMDLFEAPNRYDVFRSFVIRTGNDFRLLSGAYMTTLMDIFLPQKKRPDFVVCGVGTRVDQDDIDMGVIDTGPKNREILTAAFGALNTEMLKYACTLHFHLSEHVGIKRGFSASIEEYHLLLDEQIQDVVILSEMLNAVPILGNIRLFNRFDREILGRYYFHKGKDNKYHEGFLRGLLGEIRDLMTFEPPESMLNPKRDALRMLKAALFAQRTAKGIHGHTSLEVLGKLMIDDRANHENYQLIYQALTFFETFRFLYMLFVVQEEEIPLESDENSENLRKVASAMGYEDQAYANAQEQLMVHYRDHQRIARTGVENLIREITHHLNNITVFFPMTHPKLDGGYRGNIAVDFLKTSRFFRGTRFWEDIHYWMDKDDESMLSRFVDDFLSLPEAKQKALVRSYIHWSNQTPYPILALITILLNHRPQLAKMSFFCDLTDGYIRSLDDTLQTVTRLSQIVNYSPQRLNDFIANLSEVHLKRFTEIVRNPIWPSDVEKSRQALYSLCQMYLRSSYYFKRFIHRVFRSYPHFISYLNREEKVWKLTDGLYRSLDNIDTFSGKMDTLGDYYDFEFMRLGISMIDGAPLEEINREFTLVSDNYLKRLFDYCREKVNSEMEKNAPKMQDILAILTAGGHARGQAFDDDYDLIILLNSDDPEILEFCDRIILKMNKRIIRRSIMPHYRFADRFKHYVTTFRNIREFFDHPDDHAFIDKSQLLGARMIVGTTRFYETFIQEIIQPYIFSQKEEYIQHLRSEFVFRKAKGFEEQMIDIKESPGGLRDMENFLFILKAQFEISSPISAELIDRLSDFLLHEKTLKLKTLFHDYLFIKHVRDLYRLMVSDDNHLQKSYLAVICQSLAKSYRTGVMKGEQLFDRIQVILRQNADGITEILMENSDRVN